MIWEFFLGLRRDSRKLLARFPSSWKRIRNQILPIRSTNNGRDSTRQLDDSTKRRRTRSSRRRHSQEHLDIAHLRMNHFDLPSSLLRRCPTSWIARMILEPESFTIRRRVRVLTFLFKIKSK